VTDRIIGGGIFAFPTPGAETPTPPPFLTREDRLFVNARSAIAHVVGTVAPGRVWLPSYLCQALLDTVRGTDVRLYEVTGGLRVEELGWLDQLEPGDLVVVVDYFGFPAERRVETLARDRGAWVLEDAAQALLTDGVGEHADFTVFSPRKFVGVPDGGVLRREGHGSLPPTRMEQPPVRWWRKALAAVILRRDFDAGNGSGDWFPLGQQVEREAPVGRFTMSEVSQRLLETAFDYRVIARRRRENYAALLSHLGSVALFPTLSPEVVPLGFPIVLGERDRIRDALFADQIYPMVHWPIEGLVPEGFRDSHRLSARILTLPCDQRYGPGEMERVASRVLEALG
jgi:hypothetical protein